MLKVNKAPSGTLSKPKVKPSSHRKCVDEAGRQDSVRIPHVRNFNQSLLAQYLKQSVLNLNFTNNNATIRWLQDLRTMSENECLCVLQAKSLVSKLAKQKAALASSIDSSQLNGSQPAQTNNMSATSFGSQKQNANNSNLSNDSVAGERDELSSASSSVAITTKNSGFSKGTSAKRSSRNSIEKPVRRSDEEVFGLFDYLISKSGLINDEFAKIIKKTEKSNWLHIPDLLRRLLNQIQININSFNHKCLAPISPLSLPVNQRLNSSTSDSASTKLNFKELEECINKNINQIKKFTERILDEHAVDKIQFLDLIKNLESNYQKFYNNAVCYCVQLQLSKMQRREIGLNGIAFMLNQILELCLKNDSVKKLIIEHNGIFLLFQTLKEPYYKSILDLILRTLSILCSCFESFKSLKQIDCFGILTDILCDENALEWTRTEAAGCIAQITSPSLDFCHNLTGFYENMQDLTRALTVLCRDSSDIEIFLIGTAALANLTFIDNVACEHLNQFSTAQVLIENFYLKCYNSIFVKDQIITIIANMALLENCRSEIVEYNGLNLIADFLNEKPSLYMQSTNSNCLNNSHGANSSKENDMILSSSMSSSFDYNNNSSQNGCINNTNSSSHSSGNLSFSSGSSGKQQQQPLQQAKVTPSYEPELLACERVQQKSAIAISRFCKEKQYALGLVDLGVVSRLVFLSRNAHERNNSDSVLVACLAALRQLAVNCDSKLLMDADVQQLIKPKLKDSFFICSTAESYV